MKNPSFLLFDLIKSEIFQKNIENDLNESFSSLTAKEWDDLYQFANMHDLCHLVGAFLEKNTKAENEITIKFKKKFYMAVFRCEQLKTVLNEIEKTFESNCIPYMALKGSVIRRWYLEPWMRTSCDIDVLVGEKDLENAKYVLMNERRYAYLGQGSHDLSFYAPNNVHVELHYTLIEDEFAKDSSKVLRNVWKKAVNCEGLRYKYEMSDDMFYFYHIAHMARHFETGGCGIRPFIDLWILDRLDCANRSERDALLSAGGLLQFANAARKLCGVWFNGEEADDLSQQMQDYILSGGAYGTTSNRIAFQQQKRGGRTKYILSKVFLPYNEIKFHYPILQRHRWLTPFMEIRRWFKLLFCGHLGRVSREARYSHTITDDDARNTRKLLQDLGL